MLTMGLMVLAAMVSPLGDIFDLMKESTSLNCPGFTHPTTPALSYNSSLASDTVACIAVDSGLGLIVLAFMVGGILSIIYGRRDEAAPEII